MAGLESGRAGDRAFGPRFCHPAAEKELAVNTLAMLKAQLQPHFLFNTLHVISALVKNTPEAAERMIARLSDLLRASMKGTDAPEATLTAELYMLMNYVEIVQGKSPAAKCMRRSLTSK